MKKDRRFEDELVDLEMGTNLGMIHKARPVGRGGGTAVVFSKRKVDLKEVKLKENYYEIVACVGKMPNNTSCLLYTSPSPRD